jgi:predicted DNA-binding protein YlxM (UPF0122 family)
LKKPNPQFDPGPKALGPFIEALRQALPVLEKLVEIGHELLTVIEVERGVSGDLLGLDKEITTEQYKKILNASSGVHHGRGRKENLTGFHPETLQEAKNRRQLDVFEEYLACKEKFTSQQWEAIYLYWKTGMSQAQIARHLGLKRSAVSGRLTRAVTKKQQHDKKMRKEQLEYLKKMQKESSD